MKKVYLLACLAAVLFGALMFLYLQGTSAQATTDAGEKTTTVVVATVDIGPETTITEDMVKEVEVALSSVQPNVLTSKDKAVGKCCPAQIVKGEQLLSNMLEDPGETGVRLANQLKSGMRAMTVKVETDAGVGGYLKAGDYIDLLGVQIDTEGNVIASGSIVQNVEIVRVNEASKEGQSSYSYITLSMTESQCAQVYAYQAVNTSGATTDFHAILRPTGGA